MATDKELGSMDEALTRAQPVYTRQQEYGQVVLLGQDRNDVVFASSMY